MSRNASAARGLPPITQAIRAQLKHGRYAASTLYGDGFVAGAIAKAIAMLQPYRQKRLHYIYDADGSGKDNADANPSGIVTARGGSKGCPEKISCH